MIEQHLPVAREEIPVHYATVREVVAALQLPPSEDDKHSQQNSENTCHGPVSNMSRPQLTQAVRKHPRSGDLTAAQVEYALDFLEDIGQIRLVGQQVFLQPVQLFDIIRVLVRHDFRDLHQDTRLVQYCCTQQQDVQKLRIAMELLVTYGVLQVGLVDYLWQDFLPNKDARAAVVGFLAHCGVLAAPSGSRDEVSMQLDLRHTFFKSFWSGMMMDTVCSPYHSCQNKTSCTLSSLVEAVA